jgi:ribosomal protein S18 acetylase RimI-like enzyme
MIRKALHQDIQKVVRITQACARHMIAEGIYQWNENYPSAEAFERDVNQQELYVLEKEGEVRGAVVISTQMDDFYRVINWLTPSSKNGYLHRLCVHPESQGKGYARKLLDFAEDQLKKQGCLSVRLDTFSKNHRNQRLYEARGYKKLGDVYFSNKSEYPFHCYELVF